MNICSHGSNLGKPAGALIVVGLGVATPGHLTIEARSYIVAADKLLYYGAGPLGRCYLMDLNDSAEDLVEDYTHWPGAGDHYKIVARILDEVRRGKNVCVAFFGHPGSYSEASHDVIRVAKSEGFRAVMLASVSLQDALVADLGVHTGYGCQAWLATDFVLQRPRVDRGSHVILWNIGAIAESFSLETSLGSDEGLRVLAERLAELYSLDHHVTIYEPALYPICDPWVDELPVAELPYAAVQRMSTLCIPPDRARPVDRRSADRLGIDQTTLRLLGDTLPSRAVRGAACDRVEFAER